MQRLKSYIALALVAVVAISMIAPSLGVLTYAQGNQNTKGNSHSSKTTKHIVPASLVVEKYIRLVESRLNLTQFLINKYNITLMNNLTAKLQDAKQHIDLAWKALQANETEDAVNNATIAHMDIGQVLAYILAHLPKSAKQQIRVTEIMRIIQVRYAILNFVKSIIANLSSANITLPQTVFSNIKKMESLLNEAEEKAKSGNITATHELIHEFDKTCGQTTGTAMKSAHVQIITLKVAMASVDMFVHEMYSIDMGTNITIVLLSYNRTGRALGMLEHMTYHLNVSTKRLVEMRQKISNINGSDKFAIKILDIEINASKSIEELMVNATGLIKDNETNAAIIVLTKIPDVVNTTITQLKSLNLPTIFKSKMEALVNVHKSMKNMAKQRAAKAYAGLMAHIDKMIMRLKKLKQAYEHHKIKKDIVVKQFQLTLYKLEKLKQHLQEKAPKPVINKINWAINWIKENMPK